MRTFPLLTAMARGIASHTAIGFEVGGFKSGMTIQE